MGQQVKGAGLVHQVRVSLPHFYCSLRVLRRSLFVAIPIPEDAIRTDRSRIRARDSSLLKRSRQNECRRVSCSFCFRCPLPICGRRRENKGECQTLKHDGVDFPPLVATKPCICHLPQASRMSHRKSTTPRYRTANKGRPCRCVVLNSGRCLSWQPAGGAARPSHVVQEMERSSLNGPHRARLIGRSAWNGQRLSNARSNGFRWTAAQWIENRCD